MPLVDAHFHLTDEFLSDFIDLILTSIKTMRIKVCSVCVDNQTSLRSISLLSHPDNRNTVAQFVGIHPSFAKHEDVVKFCSMLESNIQSIDGIGEIGLDRTYTLDNYSPYPKQLEVFELMLRLAERYHRPVSVHSRKSLDDIMQLMSTFRIPGVMLHWFSGSKKQLERCLDRGYYISYGPALLYSQDKQVLLKKTDKDKILIETDGPNRYSHCFGNFPALPSSVLTSVAKTAGEMLGMSYEETLQMLSTNWCNFINQKL